MKNNSFYKFVLLLSIIYSIVNGILNSPEKLQGKLDNAVEQGYYFIDNGIPVDYTTLDMEDYTYTVDDNRKAVYIKAKSK
ncbi:MAG: hypothetical protein UIC64_07795 [Agathobacter sp.]|nr:hypothetical protein [Agathobacter sp.]MEE1518014.1 hypothetical protein [Lachnospiraceae bacterium]